MASSEVTVSPATPADYLPIARLMAAAFAHEEYGAVAFGPERASDAAIESSAKSLAKPPKSGETLHHIKAVTLDSEGREEIVGFASWSTCIGRTGSEEEKERLGTKKAWAEEEKEKAEAKEKGEEGKQGGNAQLREDSLGKGDVIQARSTSGLDYSKLGFLVVSPSRQRQGIGKMLLEDGLKRADEAGLQTVLGASDQGIGLYRKHGFVDFEIMDLKLWEYEGGEGLGVTRHVIMHRPAARGSSKAV